jgi:hypothetical protein
LELSTCTDNLLDGDAHSGNCTFSSDGRDSAAHSNTSFDHSFDGLQADCDDALLQQSAPFDVECSFNEVDAAMMDHMLAEFIAAQGQGASAVAKPTSGSKAAGSSVEDALARQAAQGLAAKEVEMNRVTALTDKVRPLVV